MPEERLVEAAGGTAAAAPFVDLMEAEFVAGKGRSGHLPVLYPDVFAARGSATLFGLLDAGGTPVAALGLRRFRLRVAGSTRRGAMIGFVVTRERDRGRQIGMRLMDLVTDRLRTDGTEFGVLWAKRPDLYLKLGWESADTSLLGRWTGPAAAARVVWETAPFAPALRRRLNRLRPSPEVERRLAIYDKRPYPADRLVIGTVPGGYVLVGVANGTGYAFEIGGRPELAPGLLAAAAGRWPDLWVNGAEGAPISRRLAESGMVAFKPNRLAMWCSLARRFEPDDAVWIPYLDRI